MRNEDVGLLLMYLIGYGVLFLIGAFITRAIFSIPTIIDNLKQQTEYLKDIAVTQRTILKNQEDKR